MSTPLKVSPKFDEVIKKITDAIISPQARRKLLLRAVVELKDLASAYPVEGRWNKPPGTNGDNRWYQRNFGARWKRKNGTLGGRNTSEKLQKNWGVEVKSELVASAFTEVSYAPFLLDPDKRVSWAAVHGWQSTDEIAEDYAPRFEEIALEEVDENLKKTW
jgi:hypothetical protein